MEVDGGEEELEATMVPSWRATYDSLVGVLRVDGGEEKQEEG